MLKLVREKDEGSGGPLHTFQFFITSGYISFFKLFNSHAFHYLKATSIIIAKTWKQLRFLAAEWIKNKKQKTLWYIQIMEYYSVIKRNELSSHEKMSRKFECTSLSERNKSEKASHCTILTLRHSGRGNTVETVKAAGEGRGGAGTGRSTGDFTAVRTQEGTVL